MDSSIFKKAGELLSRKSKYRHWQAVVAVLGVVVIGTTAIVLSQPAQTMTKETFCGMEEHAHTDECYERVLICGLEEEGLVEVEENGTSSGEAGQPLEAAGTPAETLQPTPEATQAPEKEPHQHDDSCYEEYLVLDCQEAEAPIHQLGCYAGAEMLICGQEESADHIHTDECYNAVPVMAIACGQEESDTHTHSEDGEDSCYILVGAKKLICGMEESGEHTHTEGCYELIPAENFQCMEGHIHRPSCYPQETEPALICGLEEQEAHTHTDECYTVTQKEELICGQEASEEHEHTAECYQTVEEKELSCGKEETEGHTHTEECYSQSEETAPICGREEKEVPPADAHVHTIACCRTERKLICGKEEYIPEETEEPASEETAESMATPEASAEPEATPEGSTQPKATAEASAQPEAAPENSATPDAGTQPEATPESSTAPESEGKHVHTEACYEMRLVCGLEEHTHTDECYKVAYCGIPAHVHMPGCYDEEGNVICGKEEHIHEGNCYKEPHCGITVHTHTEECYDENGELICGMEEHIHGDECFVEEDTYTGPFHCQEKIHQHTADCYDEENNLICGLADYVVHTHTEACYDEDGQLICPLPEIEEHAHSAQCYDIPGEGEEAQLSCGKEEVKLHTHTEDCYDEEGNLTCGMLQVEEHVHSDDCLKETEGTHIHTESCYDKLGNLVCGYDETAGTEESEVLPFYCADYVHKHSEDCYDENGELICGKADFVAHIHTEDCYNKAGELVCPLPEIEAHTHTAECYSEADEKLETELICGKTDNVQLHTHTEDCYDADGKLICGKLEVLEHVHSDACHVKPEKAEVENITYYCNEMVHEHSEDCYNENGELICGEADYVVHTHTEKCYGADEALICPLPEVEVHTHTEECYDENGQIICGKEEAQLHTHTEECYDENSKLICDKLEVLEHTHSTACEVPHRLFKKTCEGVNFIVTASYKADANIPEEAVLIAEQITEESDEEHYVTRQTQYQEAVGNEKAVMRALLKIGFYVNGEEVEPDSPVTVSIQFLDEDGLLEGSPITIVHFAEEGTGVLDGGDAIDNSTTFRTGSFSEFAIGYGNGVGEQMVLLSDTFQYDDSAVHISFSIKGEATVIGKAQEVADADSNVQMITADADQMMVLRVKVLDEGEQRFQAYSNYLKDEGEQNETLFLQVMSFRLFYGDKELDLSNCTITTQVEPTTNLLEDTQNVEEQEEEVSSVNFLSVFSLSPDGKAAQENLVEIVPDEEISAGLTVENSSVESGLMDKNGTSYAAKRVDTDVDEEAEVDSNPGSTETAGIETDADSATKETTGVAPDINEEATENGMRGTGENADIAVAVIVKVNPMFTVQFYANLNAPESTVGTSGTTLPFIDTSKDTGLGRLPQNGEMEMNEISLGLKADGSIFFNIKPTEIYKHEQKEFNPRLGDEFDINYLNSLRDNVHYTKKELWVLNEIEGESEENRAERALGTERDSNWTIYDLTDGGEANIAFTNNVNLSGKRDEKGRIYIVIEEGTIMRLVYDPASDNYNSKATFYDYDISKGPKSLTTMDTTRGGINAYLPESGNGRFAFGNGNMGTQFQNDTWNGNLLNQYNRESNGGKDTFKGLALGLVERMTSSDKGMDVVFSGGVRGPSIGLFGGTSGVGKTIYPNWNLNFSREGDTFTLSSVSMSDGRSVASGLEKFNHPGTHNHIWTNNFWPLDQKYYDGQETILDHIFGGKDNPTKGSAGKVASDDGIDHNSYFGMTYSVDFDLVEEYVGPLEYYFYGDDDMWVFLTDKETNTTTLVCDIGGVHSSVGEYVNLWDHIKPRTEGGISRLDHAKKQYTLSIFYTERGASGSSCWMQFTLPKISQTYNEPYDPNAASLTIKKVAQQFPESMKDTEFPFVLRLGGIYNEYTVRRVSATGSTIEETTISTKEYPFKLKSGEYLEVISLPIGTTYWVEEKYDENRPGDYTTIVETTGKFKKEEPKLSVLAHGTINAKKEGEEVIVEHVTVTYTNTYVYKLPETGGSGRNLYTMAGGMVVLFGAGLMYRKKFRERRG
ncbi:MAG TPA: hypothetical protein DCZ91_06310 [Lachnospiraceae bacterium]|nr:hypothetical protein [Lachnospiraceae bacterium]